MAEPQGIAVPAAGSGRWWRIADLGVFGVWLGVVAWILPYHEKWYDEAQAWLIARDLPLGRIWFYELRYEGAPPLWHTLLWVALHFFHLPYGALGYIGMAGAAAGVALLIFKAPFPRWIRWPLAFTYVMVYQYAVIARPYTLLPLLVFAVALCFNDLQRPVRMTVVLVLLANLSFHGTALAACFGLCYLIQAFGRWKALEARVRERYVLCIGAVVLTFLFLYVILKPTPDVAEFVRKAEIARMSPAERAQIGESTSIKFNDVLSGAFLDATVPSILFLCVTAVWCYSRRRLLVFFLPAVAMICIYGLLHGNHHHQGAAFVAVIGSIWIAWPAPQELREDRLREVRGLQIMMGFIALLCAVNLWDAAVAIRNERRLPYSGAEDAARYLKMVGADQGAIFGFLDGAAAVQPYFDHNIFTNSPTSYTHHGLPYYGRTLDVNEMAEVAPEYVVVYSSDPSMLERASLPILRDLGYEQVHFSEGHYIYKRKLLDPQDYWIFRRVSGVRTPWPADPGR